MRGSTSLRLAGAFFLACALAIVVISQESWRPWHNLSYLFVMLGGALYGGGIYRDHRSSKLSLGRTYEIKALSGPRSLEELREIFSSSLNQDNGIGDLCRPCSPTPALKVVVSHKRYSEGIYSDIFMSLPGNFERRCLTRSQIAEFCATMPAGLREEKFCSKLFFCKEDEDLPLTPENLEDNLCLFLVDSDKQGLFVFKDRVRFGVIDCSIYDYRVILPRSAAD